MIGRILPVIGVILSVTAQAQPLPASVRRMVDSVSLNNLSAHVRQPERAGGSYSRVRHTAGNDSAVAYILRQFRAIPRSAFSRPGHFDSSLLHRRNPVRRTISMPPDWRAGNTFAVSPQEVTLSAG